MKAVLVSALGLLLASCGDVRSATQVIGPEPRISLVIERSPFTIEGRAADEVLVSARLSTEDPRADSYRLYVEWTSPDNFPEFSWAVGVRREEGFTQVRIVPGISYFQNTASHFELDLGKALPDAVELRYYMSVAGSLKYWFDDCPVLRTIRFVPRP